MKKLTKTIVCSAVFVLVFSAFAFAEFQYKGTKIHMGEDLDPVQAHEMLTKDPGHTFLVDVRTRPEYQLLGHPEGACNVPVKFWTIKAGKKGYEMAVNPDFGKDLLARFNPKTDTLLFLCRSGSRSCISSTEAVKAGFTEDKVFNIMGGFEGGKMKYKSSACCGKRIGGSWKNEGLPWTYHMDKRLMYQPDVAE